ncbi:uncharacterized protein ARMOST_22038 [Armillaria ostoyae]|uniref:Uncharacterized protein n=1 Tax=Armillaria ostoyae TaxID=47428 RepID=A0A284SBU7_ARMOS|nr:uncharacterized protein ARMOST_22038 [Armillaria ostoyae]
MEEIVQKFPHFWGVYYLTRVVFNLSLPTIASAGPSIRCLRVIGPKMTRRRNVPLAATSTAYDVLSVVAFQSKCSNEDRSGSKGPLGLQYQVSRQSRFSTGQKISRISRHRKQHHRMRQLAGTSSRKRLSESMVEAKHVHSVIPMMRAVFVTSFVC